MNNAKKTQAPSRGRPDFLLLAITILLVGFGLVMVFSSSASIAAVNKFFNYDPLYFTKRQAAFAIVGIFAMLVVMNIRYSWFKKGFVFLFIPVVIMLFLVKLIGSTSGGSTSWFGVLTFGIQPTEFAKLALILYLSALIAKKGEDFRDFKRGLLPVLIITGFVCGLILLQPDLGSAMILGITAAIIIIIGGANLKHFAFIASIITAAGSAVVLYLVKSNPNKWGYLRGRFIDFGDPLTTSDGTTWHLVNSLLAMGHGGFTGTGLGESVQKLHYLKFAYNDFIFAVIAEELGFIGSFIFLLVYLCFLWRGLIIALRCPDRYGTLVGVGIVGLFGIQLFINIGGITGTIPLTGVTLPFISYGGSSLLSSLLCMGVLLSISRESNRIVKDTGSKQKNKSAIVH